MLLTACLAIAQSAPLATILVFSKTAAFRHDSIPAGVQALKEIGYSANIQVHATENAADFNPQALKQYQAVIFLNTTGDVLSPDQQSAFEKFIQRGGGYVGIHAAADTEYEWPWYGKLVGAYFLSHPAIQDARVNVINQNHPSTRHLPKVWERRDEWYDYKSLPPADREILMRLNTASYKDHKMGENHPTAWCGTFDGGRTFYTGGGHTQEAFADTNFRQHLLGGILWAARRADQLPH